MNRKDFKDFSTVHTQLTFAINQSREQGYLALCLLLHFPECVPRNLDHVWVTQKLFYSQSNFGNAAECFDSSLEDERSVFAY